MAQFKMLVTTPDIRPGFNPWNTHCGKREPAQTSPLLPILTLTFKPTHTTEVQKIKLKDSLHGVRWQGLQFQHSGKVAVHTFNASFLLLLLFAAQWLRALAAPSGPQLDYEHPCGSSGFNFSYSSFR